MPVCRSSDSAASWTLLKESEEEKRMKIGHISYNLCSVNFSSPRVDCLHSPAHLKPPSLLLCPHISQTTILPLLFHPTPLTFCGLCYSDFCVFCFFFCVSQVRMFSHGVAKFTSLHMTNTNKAGNKSNVWKKYKEKEAKEAVNVSLKTCKYITEASLIIYE